MYNVSIRTTSELCNVWIIYRVDYLRRCTQRLYGIDADRMSKINGRIVLIYCTVGCCRDVVYNVSIRTTSQCVQRQNGYNVQRLNYLSRWFIWDVVHNVSTALTQIRCPKSLDELFKIIGRIVWNYWTVFIKKHVKIKQKKLSVNKTDSFSMKMWLRWDSNPRP